MHLLYTMLAEFLIHMPYIFYELLQKYQIDCISLSYNPGVSLKSSLAILSDL